MKNLKKDIIDEYKRLGKPISIEDFCTKYSNSFCIKKEQLMDMMPLNRVHGLTLDQANELIEYYGEGFLFSSKIERNIKGYIASRKTLGSIEKKRSKK